MCVCGTECTKIAHRRSLAIFIADEGIAGNSAVRTIFAHFLRRRNRGSLAIFFAEEIAHLGASKSRAIFGGAVKIAAAAAENRAILVHSGVGGGADDTRSGSGSVPLGFFTKRAQNKAKRRRR